MLAIISLLSIDVSSSSEVGSRWDRAVIRNQEVLGLNFATLGTGTPLKQNVPPHVEEGRRRCGEVGSILTIQVSFLLLSVFFS